MNFKKTVVTGTFVVAAGLAMAPAANADPSPQPDLPPQLMTAVSGPAAEPSQSGVVPAAELMGEAFSGSAAEPSQLGVVPAA